MLMWSPVRQLCACGFRAAAPGSHALTNIADEPSFCYVLPVDRLDALSRSHPAVRTRLMANLAREMAARLRSADAEIRTLEE